MKLINGSKAGGNLKILIAVIIFSAIILFHEFGHFLFAKLNGIGVTRVFSGDGTETFQFPEGGNSLFSEIASDRWLLCNGR